MTQHTYVPGLTNDFQANLPTANTMAVALTGRAPFSDNSVPSAPTNAHAAGSESPKPLAVLKQRSVFGT